MEAYIGAIFSFGFNFAPAGWLLCNGQTLPISGYEVLFQLIGTTYGGDGVSTFVLPNLQGRMPIGTGQGPGLSNYVLGQAAGSESITLTVTNLPSHTHVATGGQVSVNGASGSSEIPTNNFFATSDDTIGNAYNATGGNPMAANKANSPVTGSSIPFEIINPYQVVNYCICYLGIYPSQP